MDFSITDAWKSFFRGKNKNIQKVYSISLWICLPWDFCASSWDHEIVLKTVSLERSALGWGRVVQYSDKFMHGIVLSWKFYIQKYKNNEQRNTMRKLNKAMHKFVGVLDKYGLGRVGGWGRTSLVWIEVWSFPILRCRPCSSARLVFTHVAISSSLMLLFQGHVAKKCVIIGCTLCEAPQRS